MIGNAPPQRPPERFKDLGFPLGQDAVWGLGLASKILASKDTQPFDCLAWISRAHARLLESRRFFPLLLRPLLLLRALSRVWVTSNRHVPSHISPMFWGRAAFNNRVSSLKDRIAPPSLPRWTAIGRHSCKVDGLQTPHDRPPYSENPLTSSLLRSGTGGNFVSASRRKPFCLSLF